MKSPLTKAIVNRDMQFTLGTRPIFLYEGQEFHMKNAYKFRPEFFEHCCERVGLKVVRAWSDSSPAKVYLLEKLPQLILQPQQRPDLQHRMGLGVLAS